MNQVAIKLDGTSEQFFKAQGYLLFLGGKNPYSQMPISSNENKYIVIGKHGDIYAMYDDNISDNYQIIDPFVNATDTDIRSFNIGESDYSKHKIQPWDIILEYGLNFFDGSILSYLLRKKATDPRKQDYQKIIHYCQERIRQIDLGIE